MLGSENRKYQAQYDTHTAPNRYPLEFKAIQRIAKSAPRKLKILSFGCSIGDEVLSLAAHFPGAELYGCDINTEVLKIASERCNGLATIFNSTPFELIARGPFDVITCMSVLCLHGTNAENFENEFPFSKFQDILLQLGQVASSDSILLISNTSYFVDQSGLKNEFLAVHAPSIFANSYVNKYDKNQKLVLRARSINGIYIYKLEVPWGEISDSYLTNSIYVRGIYEKLSLAQCPDPHTVLDSKCAYYPNSIDMGSSLIYRGRLTSTVKYDSGVDGIIYQNFRRSVEDSKFYLMEHYIDE